MHPLAGSERIDLGIVQSGDYFNRTPGRSVLTGTRRWLPGKTIGSVLTELEGLASPFASEGKLHLTVDKALEREPFETPHDDPCVQATVSAHKTVTGKDAEYVGRRLVGDANIYANGTGISTYYYGPSNETAHSDDEWVSIDRMESAAKVYALTAMRYCGLE